MRLIPRTWWNRVAAALGLLLAAVAAALVAATHLVAQRIPAAQPVADFCTVALLVDFDALLLWLIWVCPTLDAGDPDPRKLAEPRRYLRGLQHTLWMPVFLSGLIAFMILIGSNQQAVRRPPSPPVHSLWWPSWRELATWVAVVVAFALVAWWLSGVTRRRLLRAVAQRHICFNCGYDLRGNPNAAACPECGAPVPAENPPAPAGAGPRRWFSWRSVRPTRLHYLCILFLISGVACTMAVILPNLRASDQGYSLVEEGLYLGGWVPAPPPGTRAVVNVCERADPYACEAQFWEPIRDLSPAPDLTWLRRVVQFIDQQRQSGRIVYVHCRAGLSRSSLVMTAYLMQHHAWSRDRALAFVQAQRPGVRPNRAFMDRLAEWERELAAPPPG